MSISTAVASFAPRFMPGALTRLPTLDRVALTIDDGPDPVSADVILRILSDRRLHAVCFFVGSRSSRNPSLVKAYAEEGHCIGNHGFEHVPLAWTSSKTVRNSIDSAQMAICDAGCVPPRYFRPPFGWWNPMHNRLLRLSGLQLTLWDVMPMDFNPRSSVEASTRTMERLVTGGSIVVLHDNVYSSTKLPYLLHAFADVIEKKRLACADIGREGLAA